MILFKARKFIENYLNLLRHIGSQIPLSDRGIFPSYWFNPYQIIIYKNGSGDIAILMRRKVSGKRDKFIFRRFNGRIEESVLPNLDYGKWSMFKISNVRAQISEIGFNLNGHPLFKIGRGSDVKFMNIRVEASVRGYPREFEFLWVLTFPNQKYFLKKIAEKDAENDFWGRLSYILANQMSMLSSRKLGTYTISLFIKLLDKVRSELNSLISRVDLVEAQLQEFLERHYFLLWEDKPLVKKMRKIGEYISDFTLELSDGSLLLVELQLNNDPIIVKGNLSKGFKEAITQLNDWFGWLNKNEKANLDKYSGLIIIGRKEDYENNKETINKVISRQHYPIKLKTYDDLNENIDKIKALLLSLNSSK